METRDGNHPGTDAHVVAYDDFAAFVHHQQHIVAEESTITYLHLANALNLKSLKYFDILPDFHARPSKQGCLEFREGVVGE